MGKFMEGHRSFSSPAVSFYACAVPGCEASSPRVFITALWNRPEAEQLLCYRLTDWKLRPDMVGGSPDVIADSRLSLIPRQMFQSGMKVAWGEVCGPLVFSDKFGLLSCFFPGVTSEALASISSALACGLHLGLVLVQEKCFPKLQSVVIQLRWPLNTNTQPNECE